MLEEENLKSDFFKDLNSKTCNDKISKLLYSNAHTNIHNTTKHIIIQNNMCVCVCVHNTIQDYKSEIHQINVYAYEN